MMQTPLKGFDKSCTSGVVIIKQGECNSAASDNFKKSPLLPKPYSLPRTHGLSLEFSGVYMHEPHFVSLEGGCLCLQRERKPHPDVRITHGVIGDIMKEEPHWCDSYCTGTMLRKKQFDVVLEAEMLPFLEQSLDSHRHHAGSGPRPTAHVCKATNLHLHF